jgi:hypothetical protein
MLASLPMIALTFPYCVNGKAMTPSNAWMVFHNEHTAAICHEYGKR